MKERLTRNLDLKILAIVFAIILWLVVVNIDDPIKTQNFNGIEVQILNAQELESKGQCYEVLDNTDVVNVSVVGRRSVVEKITKDNITATADISNLSSVNSGTIVASVNKSANDVEVKVSEPTIRFNIEPLTKITKRLTVDVEGNPADGYVLAGRTLGVTQVEISGPKSIIDSIDTAKASINVDNATSTVSASSQIFLYDKAGKKVSSSRLELSNSGVSITQEIQYSKIVEINYQFSGEPEEGYALTGDIKADRTVVTIRGRKSQLDGINSINVRGEDLSVEGERTNKTVEINLNDYLPFGVEIAEEKFNGKISVTAVIRRETHLDLEVNTVRIQKKGLATGKNLEIIDDGTYVHDSVLKVRLTGLATALNEVDEDAIPVILDLDAYMSENNLKEMANGYYSIAPSIELPEGVRMDENCKIRIRITDR